MRAVGARPSIHPSIPEMAAAVQAIRKQKRESLAAERVVNVFLKYDSDGSGAIDKEELMSALRELGMSVTGVQADVVIRNYVPAGSATTELNREQFERLVHDLQTMQAAISPRASPRTGGGRPAGGASASTSARSFGS